MRASAVIPVKRFGAAKQRLLETLDRQGRAALVRAMLADVLAATAGAELTERVIVVTGERRAERIALRGARRTTQPLEILRDPRDNGHSEAATLGILRAQALGASCVALLPGDCPLLDPAELDAALDRMRSGRVAIVPDRHGTEPTGFCSRRRTRSAPPLGPAAPPVMPIEPATPRMTSPSSSLTRLASTSTPRTTSRRWPRSWSTRPTEPPRQRPNWRDWVG